MILESSSVGDGSLNASVWRCSSSWGSTDVAFWNDGKSVRNGAKEARLVATVAGEGVLRTGAEEVAGGKTVWTCSRVAFLMRYGISVFSRSMIELIRDWIPEGSRSRSS